MVKVNEQMLIGDLCSTAFELCSGTNNDFIKNNYSGFYILNEALFYNFGKIILLNNYIDNKHIDKVLEKNEAQSIDRLAGILNDNQDEIFILADNYNKFMKKIEFHPYPFYDINRKYNEKDFKDIILGYFNTFGNDILKIVIKYFDEGRIHFNSFYDGSNTAGYFVGLQWLDSGYIFTIYNDLDTTAATAIVHELGHAIDAERLNFPQKKKNPIFSDYLGEVPSTTFELGFNDYLIDNHIDIDGSRILNNNRLHNVIDYFDTLSKVISKDDIGIYSDGFAEDEEGEEYDVRDSLLYGLGYYYSMHLNKIRKEDNKEFLKVFNDLITLRKEMSFKQSAETMGIDFEDFISGKYIQPKIKQDLMELKKRYKY